MEKRLYYSCKSGVIVLCHRPARLSLNNVFASYILDGDVHWPSNLFGDAIGYQEMCLTFLEENSTLYSVDRKYLKMLLVLVLLHSLQ